MDPRRLEQIPRIMALSLAVIAAVSVAACRESSDLHTGRRRSTLGPEALASYVEARRFYNQERFDDALGLLLEIQKSNPGFAESSFLTGKVQFFQGQYRAARGSWEATLERHPHHVDTRKWLARLHLLEGRPAAAESIVVPGLSDSAEDPELLILLGKSRRAQGDVAGAFECYRKAQVLSERLAEASLELAELYREFGLSARAAQELERAASVLPATGALSRAVQEAARRLDELDE